MRQISANRLLVLYRPGGDSDHMLLTVQGDVVRVLHAVLALGSGDGSYLMMMAYSPDVSDSPYTRLYVYIGEYGSRETIGSFGYDLIDVLSRVGTSGEIDESNVVAEMNISNGGDRWRIAVDHHGVVMLRNCLSKRDLCVAWHVRDICAWVNCAMSLGDMTDFWTSEISLYRVTDVDRGPKYKKRVVRISGKGER